MASLLTSSTVNKPPENSIAFSWQTLFGIMSGLSVFVKFLCVSLCIGYLLSFSGIALDLLAVSPGKLVPPNFWIWSILTHSLVEVHCWVLAWDIAVIVLFGRYFEPLWSAVEVVRFFLIVTTVPVVMSSATYLGWYLVLRDPDLLFENHLHGFASFIAALTVAVKQMEADAVLFTSPFGKLRRRHVPLSLFVCSVLLRVVGVVDSPFPILFFWGAIVCWVYLRYYQAHTGNRRGDMADSFSFATFFPESVQPFVAVVSNSVYAVLVSIKLCKKVTKHYEMRPAQSPVIVTLPGTDAHDAERRRQLALKALNERLRSVPAGTSWPSMEDVSETVVTGRSVSAAGHTESASSPSPIATDVNIDSSDTPAAVSTASSTTSEAHDQQHSSVS